MARRLHVLGGVLSAATPLPTDKSVLPVAPSKVTSPRAGGVPGRWTRFLGPLEIIAGVVLLLASAALHWQQKGAAGGIWRDEATSVQVAAMPSLAKTWSYLEFDSFPILFHLVVRSWSGLFTAGDASLRTLGFLIGLGVLGTCWLGVRLLGVRVPLFTLALLGLNPMMVRYGDSMRAYGLGCALAVLAAAAVWRVAVSERVEWRRVLLAMLAGVLSVQALYHNAGLLLASCAGGAVVALWGRRWRVAAVVLATGAPAALSLLPYLPALRRAGQWNVLFKFPVTASWLWKRLSEVTGAPDPAGIWMWPALVFGALGLAAWRMIAALRSPAPPTPEARRQVAAAVTLAVATVVYGVFLRLVGYVTEPWYYIAYLTLAAVCLDVVLGQRGETAWRVSRLLLIFFFGLMIYQQSWQTLQVRSTNVDLVAARVNAGVQPDDLVIVNRWECAISMQWYYRGAAPLMSVPPVPDHAVHRFDLVMERLKSPDPLRPLFEAIERTLRGGGHVWLVGPPFGLAPGEPMPVLPPAKPDAQGHWPAGKYYLGWAIQVDEFLIAHCTEASALDVLPQQVVSKYEKINLTRLGGWK